MNCKALRILYRRYINISIIIIIHIRPIQTDIALGDGEGSEKECEDCLLCKVSIPLREMRDHMELCPVCPIFLLY